jgi:hypothetical protein
MVLTWMVLTFNDFDLNGFDFNHFDLKWLLSWILPSKCQAGSIFFDASTVLDSKKIPPE